jgi:site-specific recombinase XerD
MAVLGVDARQVREYLARMVEKGHKDWTVNDHARAIRTFMNFLHEEGYHEQKVKFVIPKVEDRRLPILTAE